MKFSRDRSTNSTKSKMELFTTIDNAFPFDLLFAQMGFNLIIKMINFQSRGVFKAM